MSKGRKGVRIRWWRSAEAKAVNQLNRVRWAGKSGGRGAVVDTTTKTTKGKEKSND